MSSSPQIDGQEFKPSLLTGLAVQFRVIGALIMRELHTRYGRDNIGYLWMIMEPMLLAGTLAVIHNDTTGYMGSSLPVLTFTIIGYTTFIIFRGIFGRSSGALESNLTLFYHRSITILDVLISRAVLEFAGVTATMVLLLTLVYLLGMSDPPYRPLHLVAAFVLMTWFSFAIGMVTCSLCYHSKLAERLVHPISYLLMPTSGAFYLLEWLPDPYQTWLSYFPMTLILEEARYGMFELASSEFVDPLYVIEVNLFCTLCGLLAIKITRRHVHL
jgi:capsular polysaccharide transport system permease protein